MKKLLLLIPLLILTYAYLYPGSQLLLEQSTTQVLSDDTDIVPIPYTYDQYAKTLREHPSRFLYGAVYLDGTDPEHGWTSWSPWMERWIAMGFHGLIPDEQISTAFVFTLMVLDAVALFLLAQTLGWSTWLSVGLSLAWAFSCYTRARAQVHMGFVGTYHIPLAFLGLVLLARKSSWRSGAVAAFCFLMAVMVTHYYVITMAFLSPLLLVFYFLQSAGQPFKRRVLRLTLAALPAIVFLAFNFKFPIPPDVRAKAGNAYPETGKTNPGQIHPFLYVYSAKPIDYVTGDLWPGAFDLNPLRQLASTYSVEHFAPFENSHERTNGIRWSLWLLALAGVLTALLRPEDPDKERWRINIFYFVALGLMAFWLSLSPDAPFKGMGPSYWLQSLVSQIRVPSRSGIWVHFAVLMIVGFYLSSPSAPKWLKKLGSLPLLFPLLMLADYPPLVAAPRVANIRPVLRELNRSQGACGTGLFFPFANNNEAYNLYYNFLQQMRGSDCLILNAMNNPAHLQWLSSRFPPTEDYLKQLPGDDASRETLAYLAKCVPLNWIVFHPATPSPWRELTCARLGWKMNADLTCVAPDKAQPLKKYPDDC